jgi:uncharacterized protein YjiS (DUF1127 family)
MRVTEFAEIVPLKEPQKQLSLLDLWWTRVRMRRAILRLHSDQIRDAGLDRWELLREAQKPFWRA